MGSSQLCLCFGFVVEAPNLISHVGLTINIHHPCSEGQGSLPWLPSGLDKRLLASSATRLQDQLKGPLSNKGLVWGRPGRASHIRAIGEKINKVNQFSPDRS